MKLRFAALITILSVAATTGFGQRTLRAETKPAASASSPRGEIASEAARARRSLALRSSAQAARFQQVAVALNLTNRQKSSISSLVQDTRHQLAAVSSNSSLSPEQQQQAEQSIKLGMAQKFVGTLTPEQKEDLQALLLKKKEQQGANASASGGSGASAPDIPGVDAPSSSDSSDSQDSSATQSLNNDASESGSTNATASADASVSGTSSAATSQTASTSTGNSSTPATQVANAKAAVGGSASAQAKPGRLSDAQLAAILNSFVQDGSDSASTKASASAAGSSS